mgnify:CR=1 FL=1
MKRHYLRKNDSTHVPGHVIYLDSESYMKYENGNLIHSLRLLSIKYNGQFYDFENLNDFYKFLDNLQGEIWIIGHNIQNFDYPLIKLDEYFKSREFELNKFVIGNPFILIYVKGDVKFVIVDLANYYGRIKLDSIGEVFGIRKIQFEEHELIEKINPLMDQGEIELILDKWNSYPMDSLKFYCHRDIEIVEKSFSFLLDYWLQNDFGEFAYTLPGLAFNAYRHRFMDKKILILDPEDKKDAKAIQLEREAYRGGRVENFVIGKYDNVYRYDINSLYPFVMLKPQPSQFITYFSKGDIEKFMDQYLVIGRVRVKTKQPVFGVRLCEKCFSTKCSHPKKLYFPIGEFNVVLTHPEIEYGLKHDLIEDIYDFSIYKKDDLFSNYVMYFYNKKKNPESPIHRNIYKLLMNSLYGKFGQLNEEWEKIGTVQGEKYKRYEEIDESGNLRKYMIFNEDLYVLKGEKISSHSNIAIPAMISGYGRMYLWENMRKAGLEHVLYVDTDSIHSDIDLSGVLSIGDNLGQFKLEYTGPEEFYAPKEYFSEGKRMFKGIPKNAVEVDGKYQYYQFSSLRSYLKNGNVIVFPQEKILSHSPKGIVQGNRVRPIELYE